MDNIHSLLFWIPRGALREAEHTIDSCIDTSPLSHHVEVPRQLSHVLYPISVEIQRTISKEVYYEDQPDRA